jgi:hypothetical protein
MATVDRVATIPFAAIAVAALIGTGCSHPFGSTNQDTSESFPLFGVTFVGSGHWEEAHPQLGGAPTRTVNASVVWHIYYEVDFKNRTVSLINRDISGSGSAAHVSSGDIVCSGPIVASPTQTDGPTLDLVSAWPTAADGSASFQTQAMAGSAFHVCDPAWATGIHSFPGYDTVRGDAPITINLPDWGYQSPPPKTIVLPTVDAQETAQEHGAGNAPATLNVHWEGSFTVSKL